MYIYRVAKYKRPQVYLEEPNKLEIPIVISHYKPKQPVTVSRTTKIPQFWMKKERYETPAKTNGLCDWYRKRAALKKQQLENKLEQKRKREEEHYSALKDLEEELFKRLCHQEFYKSQQATSLNQSTTPKRKLRIKPAKAKSTIAKPKVHSKNVNVTKLNHYLSFGERFVNCIYRSCCQLFCCLSLLLALAVIIVILM
ncbi:hypothetical protein ACJJTC_013878 [Scirpophaga incertulas]